MLQMDFGEAVFIYFRHRGRKWLTDIIVFLLSDAKYRLYGLNSVFVIVTNSAVLFGLSQGINDISTKLQMFLSFQIVFSLQTSVKRLLDSKII